MANIIEYIVETTYPYKYKECKTETEARKAVREFKKNGIYAHIVVLTENGNDYILAE